MSKLGAILSYNTHATDGRLDGGCVSDFVSQLRVQLGMDCNSYE